MPHTHRFVRNALFAAAVVLAVPYPAAAVNRSRLVTFSQDWDEPGAWSPAGVPTTNDRVFSDGVHINLSADTAAVDDLFIINSGEVRTSGFRLFVDDGAIDGTTSISGAGSRILVTPHNTGFTALDTDRLDISSGGLLDMAGGWADIDRDLDLFVGGTLAGDGLVRVLGTQAGKLGSQGTIRAEGGTLTVRSLEGGTFDLSTAGFGVLEAIDGTATLVIDGPLFHDFNGTMNIGAGNTIQFDHVWATDTGTINFDAAGGTGTIDGATLTHGATINVNSGTARFDAPVEFETTSTVSVAAGATLDFGLFSNSLRGTTFLNGGGTPGTSAVIDGAFEEIIATVGVNGHAQLDASAVFRNTAIVNLFDANDMLRLGSSTTVHVGATFAGNGRVVNLAGSSLRTFDGVDIGVTLENRGDLLVGLQFGALGALEVEAYEQTSTGTLEIELANITPGDFDVLTVQGNALLGGTLDVSLLNNFTPVLGNAFTVLETVFGNVAGTFDTEALPTFNGLMIDVVYNPQSVVLQVIAATAVLGDYNGSGQVEQGDLDLVLQNWGVDTNTAGIPAGWVNDLPVGQIEQTELDGILQNWGDTSAPNLRGLNVPEPSAGAMLIIVLAWNGRRN